MAYLIIGYIFLFIFRPFEVWPVLGTFHMERIYMIATLLVFILAKKNSQVTKPLHYFIIGLCVLVMLAPYYSPYPEATALVAQQYPKYLVFYIVLLYGITSRRDLEKILLGFLVVMFIYEAKSLWEFAVNGRYVYRMGIVRMVGVDSTYSDPNTFSGSIIYSLPFVAMFWRYLTPIVKRKYILVGLSALVVLSVVCIIFTGSRSGQVSLLLFLLLCWFRVNRKILWWVVGAASLFVIWHYIPLEYQDRFASIWNPNATDKTAEESAEGRIYGLEDGYKLFLLRPVIGFGAGAFPVARAEVNSKVVGLEAHNLYGEVMGDTGLAGVFLFGGIVIGLWRYSRYLVKTGHPEAGQAPGFYYLLGFAIIETVILLLFEGNFGHNLYRYNWLWLSAFVMLGIYFFEKERRAQMVGFGEGGVFGDGGSDNELVRANSSPSGGAAVGEMGR